jgi:hypothetical protein
VFEQSVAFFCCESLRRIEIPASVEILSGFHSCDSLTELIFENKNESRIREMSDFDECKSLSEIEIPASAEILRGFDKCSELKKIMFLPNSFLRVIWGFCNCLIRSIELPASVEILKGFHASCLSQVIIAKGTMTKTIRFVNSSWGEKQHALPVFLLYDEEDLKKSRRRVTAVSKQLGLTV